MCVCVRARVRVRAPVCGLGRLDMIRLLLDCPATNLSATNRWPCTSPCCHQERQGSLGPLRASLNYSICSLTASLLRQGSLIRAGVAGSLGPLRAALARVSRVWDRPCHETANIPVPPRHLALRLISLYGRDRFTWTAAPDLPLLSSRLATALACRPGDRRVSTGLSRPWLLRHPPPGTPLAQPASQHSNQPACLLPSPAVLWRCFSGVPEQGCRQPLVP